MFSQQVRTVCSYYLRVQALHKKQITKNFGRVDANKSSSAHLENKIHEEDLSYYIEPNLRRKEIKILCSLQSGLFMDYQSSDFIT